MRAVLSCLCLAVAILSGPAAAQDPSLSLPPPVLTIDQDRLFAETRPGTQISADLEARATALARENEMIEAELTAAERDLTERRPTLSPEEFRDLADAFDARVQRIRAEQDQKAREITQASEAARQNFFNDVAGIISDIVRERGALLVIDRRDVFLSADRIDITDEAIQRVNAAREQ